MVHLTPCCRDFIFDTDPPPPRCSCCPGTSCIDQAGLDSRDRVQASQAVRVICTIAWLLGGILN